MRIIVTAILFFTTSALFAQNGAIMGEPVYHTETTKQPMNMFNSSYSYQPSPQPKVYRENDLVNVNVQHRHVFENKNDSQRQRKLKGKMGLTEWVKFPGLLKMPVPMETEPPSIGGEVDFQGRAKGDTKQSQNLSFKIQCRIIRKLANGNLHIEGQRQTTIGEEVKIVYFSGEIRPEDIDERTNVVSSDDVYGMVIREMQGGAGSDAIKRGYGQKAFERWSPF